MKLTLEADKERRREEDAVDQKLISVLSIASSGLNVLLVISLLGFFSLLDHSALLIELELPQPSLELHNHMSLKRVLLVCIHQIMSVSPDC